MFFLLFDFAGINALLSCSRAAFFVICRMATVPLNDGTRVIYYVDEEDTPYLVKLNAPAESVTLGDFKLALNKPNCKFFFKSIDDDFGCVPCCNKNFLI